MLITMLDPVLRPDTHADLYNGTRFEDKVPLV